MLLTLEVLGAGWLAASAVALAFSLALLKPAKLADAASDLDFERELRQLAGRRALRGPAVALPGNALHTNR